MEMSVIQSVNCDILDSLIKENRVVVCKFFAPWCGYSQRFKSVYEDIAKEIEGPMYIEVNVDDCKNSSKVHGIKRLPTTKVYCDGEVESFVGNKKAAITDYIRLKLSQTEA
nr:thioredoxin [Hymenolepis microstoma]